MRRESQLRDNPPPEGQPASSALPPATPTSRADPRRAGATVYVVIGETGAPPMEYGGTTYCYELAALRDSFDPDPAGIAQSVEQPPCKRQVPGSSPGAGSREGY
jgi:hypothetical protein